MPKKVKLISLSTYCHKAKTWDKNDLIVATVQKEDLINHPFQRIEIPKNMKLNNNLKVSVGLRNFFLGVKKEMVSLVNI